MAMARDSAARSTPTPALKKSTSNNQSMKTQKTLHGFFLKTPTSASTTSTLPERSSPRRPKGSLQTRMLDTTPSSQLTPLPSSDAPEPETEATLPKAKESFVSKKGLPSPASSANGELEGQTNGSSEQLIAFGTPSRRVGLNPTMWVSTVLTSSRLSQRL